MTGKKIFLVGMPGSGKSYFGRKLHEVTGWPLFDLDEVIESRQGMRIKEIFASRGEDVFRQIERECLVDVIHAHAEFILSTGGGTPCYFDNMEVMKAEGLTVFLQASAETLFERVSRDQERPLMQGDARKILSELLEKRLAFYQQAVVTLDEEKDVQSFLTQSAAFFRS